MAADLDGCRVALERASEAAAALGLDVSAAQDVRTRISERSGFPTDLYVLALAGGTGVGKSSLLNALAGEPISAVGVVRPTTSEPTAWVPASRLRDAAPLLEWLGGASVRAHDATALDGVVVMDLPDLDSIAREHRARVDSVLPRIDAVLWVADPEKYQDAVLHDGYLRTWVRRLERQAVVLNKVDRVSVEDAERLRRDLAARLRREALPELRILLTSAAQGRIGELSEWLAAGVESKRVVRARLAAASRATVEDLADQAGVDPGGPWRPLVPEQASGAAIEAMNERILGIVDLAGLRRQAVEATRLAARPRGGGPLGILRTVLERGSGVSERRADPQGYLRRWRDRGSLLGSTEPLRALLGTVIGQVPPPIRPAFAALADTGALTTGLGEAVDRAVVSDVAGFRPPGSRIWPVLGVAQLVATAAFILGVIWLIALAAGVGQAETPFVESPFGQLPLPVVLVGGGLLGWFVLGRLLLIHAGWLGRRWAARLEARLSSEVEASVRGAALGPLERLDERRRDLATAAAQAGHACRDEA